MDYYFSCFLLLMVSFVVPWYTLPTCMHDVFSLSELPLSEVLTSLAMRGSDHRSLPFNCIDEVSVWHCLAWSSTGQPVKPVNVGLLQPRKSTKRRRKIDRKIKINNVHRKKPGKNERTKHKNKTSRKTKQKSVHETKHTFFFPSHLLSPHYSRAPTQ